MVEYDELRGQDCRNGSAVGELRSAVTWTRSRRSWANWNSRRRPEGFWNDARPARRYFKRISSLKQKRDGILSLQTQ